MSAMAVVALTALAGRAVAEDCTTINKVVTDRQREWDAAVTKAGLAVIAEGAELSARVSWTSRTSESKDAFGASRWVTVFEATVELTSRDGLHEVGRGPVDRALASALAQIRGRAKTVAVTASVPGATVELERPVRIRGPSPFTVGCVSRDTELVGTVTAGNVVTAIPRVWPAERDVVVTLPAAPTGAPTGTSTGAMDAGTQPATRPSGTSSTVPWTWVAIVIASALGALAVVLVTRKHRQRSEPVSTPRDRPDAGSGKVFLSYSHDSPTHRERVLELSERLRKDGIETILDQYVPGGSPPEGWPRWMMNSLDAASFVLCLCTKTYYRRFRGHEVPGVGKGVDWEGGLMTQALYDARSTSNRFIPVLFERGDEAYVPEPLRPHTRYVLDVDYPALREVLLGRAGVQPGPVGAPPQRAQS